MANVNLNSAGKVPYHVAGEAYATVKTVGRYTLLSAGSLFLGLVLNNLYTNMLYDKCKATYKMEVCSSNIQREFTLLPVLAFTTLAIFTMFNKSDVEDNKA